MAKTTLYVSEITQFLQPKHGQITLKRLQEGDESQAFSFQDGQKSCVVRINSNPAGFYKDRYAYEHFRNKLILVPKVIEIGQINTEHAYCVSELLSGMVFQDVKDGRYSDLIVKVGNILQAIHGTDISNSKGYGKFDLSGNAVYESWREYLLNVDDPKTYDWHKVGSYVDAKDLQQILVRYKALIPYCPEDRKLVHGDFGANNLLVDVQRVTGVLDWEKSLYGDSLYDLANAFFCRKWLTCADEVASYWERNFGNTKNFAERILCYQLRNGLEEIYYNSEENHPKWLEIVTRRCLELLKVGILS